MLSVKLSVRNLISQSQSQNCIITSRFWFSPNSLSSQDNEAYLVLVRFTTAWWLSLVFWYLTHTTYRIKAMPSVAGRRRYRLKSVAQFASTWYLVRFTTMWWLSLVFWYMIHTYRIKAMPSVAGRRRYRQAEKCWCSVRNLVFFSVCLRNAPWAQFWCVQRTLIPGTYITASTRSTSSFAHQKYHVCRLYTGAYVWYDYT